MGLSNIEHNVIYREVELIVFHMGFGISDKMELEVVEYIVFLQLTGPEYRDNFDASKCFITGKVYGDICTLYPCLGIQY